MKLKYLIAASAVAVMAASSAHAADAIIYNEPAPVVVPVFSWEGLYIGGQVGGSWGTTDVDANGYGQYLGYGSSTSPDPEGFIGGIYAGYNFDLGSNFILGIETDFVWGDMDETSGRTYADAFGVIGSDYNVTSQAEAKWSGATRARIGYAYDRWMPYFAAGVAYGKVDTNVRTTIGDVAYRFGDNKTMVGYTVGAGVDYAMTDNVIVRLEYRYSDFGDKDYGYNNFSYNVDHSTNDVRVGIAYKF